MTNLGSDRLTIYDVSDPDKIQMLGDTGTGLTNPVDLFVDGTERVLAKDPAPAQLGRVFHAPFDVFPRFDFAAVKIRQVAFRVKRAGKALTDHRHLMDIRMVAVRVLLPGFDITAGEPDEANTSRRRAGAE